MQVRTEAGSRNYWLLLIIVLAFIARLWHIDHQSLWLDELHTMNEADPAAPLSELFGYLKTSDQHPPLFFLIEKFCFSVFGYTSLVARIPSAVAGTLSIYVIFLLARELFGKRAGMIAAVLTAINQFNLYYSQEARGYIFSFLFASLSFLFLIRLLKTLTIRASIWYAVCTLLFLYTHYFSLMAVASQVVIIAIFFFAEPAINRPVYFRRFLLGGGIIAVGYAPWLPFLKAMDHIKSFWISPVSPNFLSEFFFAYFGESDLLKPILVLLLLFFGLKALSRRQKLPLDLKNSPVIFSFVIVAIWILVSNLIPYIRSILVVPMLIPRYTIVVLPAYLIILSSAIDSISSKVVKGIVIAAFVTLSVIDLISKGFYTETTKTQFREMISYVVRNNVEHAPLIDEVSSWQQQYYFKLYGAHPNIIPGKKNDLVDSILHPGSGIYHLKEFWIIGAHNDVPLGEDRVARLRPLYTIASDARYHDAWAQLYLLKAEPVAGVVQFVTARNFEAGNAAVDTAAGRVALWGGTGTFHPVPVTKGKYRIILSADGTEVKKVFARLQLSANNQKLGDMVTQQNKTIATFKWNAPIDGNVQFKIELTNDEIDPLTGADRNAGIYFIRLERLAD